MSIIFYIPLLQLKNTYMTSKGVRYTDKQREKVINIFLKHKKNTVPDIMKKTGFGESFVSTTIDKHLNNKHGNK